MGMGINIARRLWTYDMTSQKRVPIPSGPSRGENGTPSARAVTLRDVCVNCLLTPTKGDKPGEESALSRFNLTERLFGTDTISLTTTELTLLRGRIAQVYLGEPWIAGPALKLLDEPYFDPLTDQDRADAAREKGPSTEDAPEPAPAPTYAVELEVETVDAAP